MTDLPKCCLSNDQVHKLLTTTLGNQPLTNRTILLPVTGQAFRLGLLKPAVVLVDNKKEEQVHILASPTSNLATVSTKQAQAWLQPKPKTAATQPKSALKHKNKSTPPPTNRQQQAPQSQSQLAFMEIQEEYDASGKQIRSGAVNVSQQLNAIWNNAEEPAMVDGQGWKDDEQEEQIMVQPPNIITPKPTPVSDDDYQRLAKRLDELARLEETGEALPKPTTIKKQAAATASTSSSSGSGWGKGFLNNSSKNTKSKSSKQPSSKPKAISFGANQIQEIPRIGTTPASTITQQRQGHATATTPRNNNQTRPIESSVFNGVVQERPVVMEQQQQQQRSAIRERPMVIERQQQPQQQQPTSAAPPKKRVSRFAQERSMQ